MSLLKLLFPQVRAELLRLLFADPASELHVRELERQSGLSVKTVQDELAKLLGAKLVLSERDGNRRYYRANAAHALFPDLQQLVLKTASQRKASPTLRAGEKRGQGVKEKPPAQAAGSRVQIADTDRPLQAAATARSHSVTLNEID